MRCRRSCCAPGRLYRAVPGWRPYETYAAAAEELRPGLLGAAAPLSPSEALERHGSLTEPERPLLAEGVWPPPGAVRLGTGNGPLWLHPDEASTRPAAALSLSRTALSCG